MNFELLPARDYHTHLVRAIGRAQTRVTLVSLLFLSGPLMDEVISALESALTRGVKVRIVFDTFTWYYVGRGILPAHPLRSTNRNREAATRAAVMRLRELGANITEVGQKVTFNPYRGRCHTKFTLVDDHVYGFGGVNLYDEAFHNVDYMLYVADTTLADKLDHLAGQIARGPRPDRELRLDAGQSVLVDGGLRGRSLIYTRSALIASQASRVDYVSQFCPTGPLAQHLRQTVATCYYNRPLHSPAHIGAMVAAERLFSRLPNHYRHRTFLHAKYILFELPDGTHTVITGSHNFSKHGVGYGTQEIALVSNDDDLWQQLNDFLQAYIIRKK